MTTLKKCPAACAFVISFTVLAIFAIVAVVGVFGHPVSTSALTVSCPAGVGWQVNCG